MESEKEIDLEKDWIQFLKTALNVYRARELALRSSCETKMSSIAVTQQMRNYEFLKEQIRGIQDGVALLKSLQESTNLIHNTLSCLGVSNLNDIKLRRQLQLIVDEISAFSLSIMNLYEGNINEIEIIRRKAEYSNMLNNFRINFNLLKEQQTQLTRTEEDSRRWKKAEAQVAKINLIREMKSILIGNFAGNGNILPTLQNFRSSFRKPLTVEDFSETWDVGLPKTS